MTDYADLEQRLRDICIDWNGASTVDGEPPRVVPSVGEIRATADALKALREENERLRQGIQTCMRDAEYGVRCAYDDCAQIVRDFVREINMKYRTFTTDAGMRMIISRIEGRRDELTTEEQSSA